MPTRRAARAVVPLAAALSALVAACGGDGRAAVADTTAAAAADAPEAVAAGAASPAGDASQAPAAAADTAPPRGTATVRITGGPKQVAGDFPARSCADPMVELGDTREGLVYVAHAGPHRIVLQDNIRPAPGAQRVVPVLGAGSENATMSFLVNNVEENKGGLMRDDQQPHAVTLGPDLKTAEATGTFVDMSAAGTPHTYAVSVRFTCR